LFQIFKSLRLMKWINLFQTKGLPHLLLSLLRLTALQACLPVPRSFQP